MTEFETLGALIGAMCTCAVLSYFYSENPYYRLFEHIFIGLTAGHALVMGIKNVQDLAVTKIMVGNWVYVIPIILGLGIYTRFYRKYLWISRYPYGFLIGIGTGLGMAGQFDSVLFRQTVGTFTNLTDVNNFIVFLGAILIMLYFFLSKEHTGTYGKVTRIGRWFIMFYFGITFGNISMGRISVMIWNVYILTGEPQRYVALAALIVGAASILYSRSKKAVKVPATIK